MSLGQAAARTASLASVLAGWGTVVWVAGQGAGSDAPQA